MECPVYNWKLLSIQISIEAQLEMITFPGKKLIYRIAIGQNNCLPFIIKVKMRSLDRKKLFGLDKLYKKIFSDRL